MIGDTININPNASNPFPNPFLPPQPTAGGAGGFGAGGKYATPWKGNRREEWKPSSNPAEDLRRNPYARIATNKDWQKGGGGYGGGRPPERPLTPAENYAAAAESNKRLFAERDAAYAARQAQIGDWLNARNQGAARQAQRLYVPKIGASQFPGGGMPKIGQQLRF